MWNHGSGCTSVLAKVIMLIHTSKQMQIARSRAQHRFLPGKSEWPIWEFKQGKIKQGKGLLAQYWIQPWSKLCASIKRPSSVQHDDRLRKIIIDLFKNCCVQNSGKFIFRCKFKNNSIFIDYEYFKHLSIIPEEENYSFSPCLQLPPIGLTIHSQIGRLKRF